MREVERFLRDNNSVRISRSIKDTAYKILKKKEEITSLEGKEPSIERLSKELELSEYEICKALDSLKDTVSMYEPIYNDGGDTIYLVDQIEDKEKTNEHLENNIMLKEAISNLKERERYIIMERYFMGKTQLELASEIGISQAQISRLEKNGLENIKKYIV